MMKLLHQKILQILFIIFLSLSPQLWGQVNMTVTGSYVQDFNSIVSSDGSSATWINGTASPTLESWYAYSNAANQITANSGTSNTGKLYSYGAVNGTAASDRALGSACSGSVAPIAYGVVLKNTSSVAITNITVSYTMEQWRNGGNAASQPLVFYYKISSAIINTSTDFLDTATGWTEVPALTKSTPINSATAAALNGNSPANRVSASNITIPSLSLAPGEFITLKWHDINDSGNDHGLSIDDVTINWTVTLPPANSVPVVTVTSPQTFTYGTAGSYTFTADGVPAPTLSAIETGQSTLPTGITLDASTKKISVASTVPAGTYHISISATNSEGTDTENLDIVVNKANQTITLGNITKTFGDADFTLTSTGNASGTTVTYSSGTTSVATITGNTVTIAGAGTSTITASNPGNANYNAATTTATLTVNKANQAAIVFSNLTKTYGDADFTLNATGGGSTAPVTYSSSNNNIATISNNTVTITGTGTINITASQAGDANYNAATNVVRTLTVNQKQLTVISASASDKIYDANTTAILTATAVITPSDIVGSDVVALNTYTATFNDAAAGTNKPVTATYTLNGAQAGRYSLIQPTGLTANISPKELTISGIQVSNKVEDSNTSATITGTAILDGIISPDVVTLDTSLATASFTDANVGTSKPVTITGYSLTGTNAANYTVQQPQGLTANITSASLQNQTITFNPLTDVTYGGADFALTATASSGLNVSYTSSDTSVATVSGSTVTIVGIGTATITAQQLGDSTYNPAQAVMQNLTVNQKALTVINTAVTDKTYNKTTTAQVSGTLSGIVGLDVVTLTSAGTFTTDDAGNNITVTPQYTIGGTDAGNYTLTQPSITGNILPVTLTLTNPSATNKAYDSTVAATVTGTLSGILSGDTVTLNGTGTFADKNKATGIAVTSTATLSGADAANYTLTQPTGLTANITGLTLTVIATVSGKEYNRNTNAAIIVTQTNGVVSGDDVTVNGNGTFDNYNVGTNKAVTANLTLNGTDAINYTITQPTGLTASVTPKAVTIDVTNTTVTPKVYNGTTIAQLNNTTLIGLVAGDETNVSASTGVFAQATPGTGIAVNSITLTGTAAGNYSLTQPSALTGNITPAVLTFSGVAAVGKVYDGTDAATIAGNITGKIGADVVTFIGTGTFTSADVANNIAVTGNVTLTGANASYYTITQPTGLSANITRKSITVTAAPQNKVYDRTTAATVINGTINAGGIITGDDASLASATVTGTFADYNAGTGINVTALFALQGADAANYNLISQVVGTANITPLTITANITSAAVTTKQYSNTNTAVVTGVVLNGVFAADSNLQAVTGTYATVVPGVNIPVTITLTGSPAPNYILTQPGITGTITKKAITFTVNNKTKIQGAANPALTFSTGAFASGESAANAAGYAAPTINTTANTASAVGAYPITLTGGSADYYDFTLVNGWMIVTPPVNTVFNPGTLWSNDITDSAPYQLNPFTTGDNVTANTYINVSGIGRGTGIAGTAASNRYNANGWGVAFDATDYFSFTITPANSYKINFTNFVYTAQASATGPPTQFALRSSVDGYVATIGTATSTGTTIDLTGAAYQNIATPITFRLYAWGGTNTGATFSINDFSFSGSVATIPVTTPPAITSALTDNSVIGTTDTYQITATGTPVIALSAANLPAGATINVSGLIAFDGTTPAGIYTIAITASGYYGTDTKNLIYTVAKKDQALTINPDPIPTKFLNEAPFVVSVTNTAPLAITYASSDTSVATIAQDGTITIAGIGTTTISASNTGDATYNAVSIARTFTVLPTPVITAAPASMAFAAVQGQGPSTSTQFTSISGISLSPVSGNLTLTVSTGFEIAMGIGTYSNTASFAYSAGTVTQANPQIFVRLGAGQAVGTYNGTLTISGGNATFQIPLTATVELAPAITTTATTFGPYCSGADYTISVPYTTQGTFGSGNFYVQYSDIAGVFPNDFSNIISTPSSSSPISAIIPSALTAGNYRVRVIHLSTGLTLTSSINDNGSNIVINTTATPTATALTFCNSATVANLNATGTDLKWYAAATGGTPLVATTAVTTGNYFVSQTLNGCESTRTQVAVILNITPAPTALAQTFCNSATVANLTATGTDLKWYTAATGGTALATTAVVTTGNYFVSQTLNACESPRTQVSITVNVTPAPAASVQAFCDSASVTNLTATGTNLKWYTAATGGTALSITAAVTTGNYYVSQTLNACESTRTQVAVTVNITPAPTSSAQTFCNSATVANLAATGSNLKWYATATGGTVLATTTAVATGNYFVSQTLNACEGPRTQVSVTVNVTNAPTASAQIFCNSATVANLIATGTGLKWYTDATGGTALAATTAINTGNYYVSQTINTCESARTQVAVTVNITNAPVASALTLNEGNTVANLTATGNDLKWYAAANGGTQLAASETLVSGSYFVSQTINGCESARTEVIVTIIVAPAAPIASAQVFCNAAIAADLIATGTDLRWYNIANGGTALALTDALSTGTYYVSQTINGVESNRTQVAVTINITPAPTAQDQTFCLVAFGEDLTATGTNLKWYSAATGGTEILGATPLTGGNYYVSQTVNGCESTRTEIAVAINITTSPIVFAQTLCNGSTIADLTAEGANLKWYSSLTGEDVLDASAVLATGSYYVSQTVNGCESTRTEVGIVINITASPIVSAQIICNGSTIADLTAEGTNLKWYSSLTGEDVLDAATVLATGNYYVSQTVNGCEGSRATAEVTVTTSPAPEGEATQLFSEDGKTIGDLEGEGQDIKWYATEEDAIAGVNELAMDTLLTSGSTYYATQTINGCESNEVLAVTATITLGMNDVTKFTYRYYPNPVVDKLYVESAETITHVTVYSLTGQEVINQKWNTQTGTLDVSALESAMYIVKINFGSIEKTIQIVKNKK